MHAVEKVQRNGEIENCGPYTEAERLLFQTVVVLWPAAKGGKDPQLKRDKQGEEAKMKETHHLYRPGAFKLRYVQPVAMHSCTYIPQGIEKKHLLS